MPTTNHQKKIADHITGTIGTSFRVVQGRPKGVVEEDAIIFVFESGERPPQDYYGSNQPGQPSSWKPQVTVLVRGEQSDLTSFKSEIDKLKKDLHLASITDYNAVRVRNSSESTPDDDGRPRHEITLLLSITE